MSWKITPIYEKHPSKIIAFLDHVFLRFVLDFGPNFGSIWGSFWDQKTHFFNMNPP